MRLLDSGQQVKYNEPILGGVRSFVFTGAIPNGISSNWTRKYNVYSTFGTTNDNEKTHQAMFPGSWGASSPEYFYLNSPIRAYGDSVYPGNVNRFLNAPYIASFDQSQATQIFDTCRGQSWAYDTGSYNFYLAFHPMGYYSPPYGEITALSEASEGDTVGHESELSNGACASLSYKDYNQLRGIVSANIFGSENLNPINVGQNPIRSKISPIHGPYEECPPSFTKPFYFTELMFSYAAGTYEGGVAGNPYNHNPIPTSLDYLEMQLTSRYRISGDINGSPVIVSVDGSVSNYGTGNSINVSGLNNDLLLNNKLTYGGLCQAVSMEASTTAGMDMGGTLELLEYDPASPLNAGSLTPSFNYNPWHYWHFTFKENHDYLPFYNSQESSPKPGVNPRPQSKGTQLFEAKMADSDHWWENRQCPETVDFLPWTFGASIYDCPRNYFEVPYYSAIGKFGYFGTRFQTTCKTLIRDTSNDIGGQKLPIPVYEIETPLPAPKEYNQGEQDGDGHSSDFYFNNLLATAKREQNYTEWSVGNRGFYLWANCSLVESSPNYQKLVNLHPDFIGGFNSLKAAFSGKLNSLQSYVAGGSQLSLKVGPDFKEDYDYYDRHTQNANDFSFLDKVYEDFSLDNRTELTGDAPLYLDNLINEFGFLFKNPNGSVNYDSYKSGISGQEERIRTRYLLNISNGRPIDLFPTNHVSYSFDNKTEYQNSSLWGRRSDESISSSVFGENGIKLPEVPRRYFEGSFTRKGSLTELIESYEAYKLANPNSLDDAIGKDFTLGGLFKNESCGKMESKGVMLPVSAGSVTQVSNNLVATRMDGWMALGYNELGKIDNNFSCFTPVMIQQPKNAFCKIGQYPTFRSFALDYHTLPEDKVKIKHPEIYYWANKLKLLSKTNQYLYPMKYKWGRLPISNSGQYMRGNYRHSSVELASSSSSWGCLENDDGKDCTFIHPKECVSSDGATVGYFGSEKSSYSYLQGVKGADTQYLYFCLASGRYGVRGSDPFIVEADRFILFNAAYINGGGASISPQFKLKVDSTVNNGFIQDGSPVDISPINTQGLVGLPFDGVKQDDYTIPEETMVKKKYIRNGGGQNVGFGFDGANMYRGFLRSYSPETLEDTRGQQSTNQRPIEYGSLLEYRFDLTDRIGGAVYGHSHLPVCSNYQMVAGCQGVRIEASVNGNTVSHKLIEQKAEIGMTNPPSPMKKVQGYTNLVPAIYHIGQLYNSSFLGHLGTTTSWQFHQNLGSVRRFGKATSITDKGQDFVFVNDISSANPAFAEDAFNYVHDVILTPSDLAGSNCGYVKASMGRKMLYFVEAFDRFYLLCDAKAKYNVQNKSFIAPGLRYGDSPFQYTWIGQPSDSYLTRKSMYGAYAFQWKVNRHNRDRLGNGISQGYYSMGWKEKYSQMYDLAAIYGLYCKNNSNQGRKTLIDQIKAMRALAFPNTAHTRRLYLGRNGGPGDGFGYGDVRANCEASAAEISSAIASVAGVTGASSPDPGSYIAKCAYYELSSSNLFDGSEYYCGLSHIKDGICFDPCLSIGYSQGFIPGGKKITHMTNGAAPDPNGGGVKYKTAITHNGLDYDGGLVANAGNSPSASIDYIVKLGSIKSVLRGPANTPYSKGVKNGTLAISTPYVDSAGIRRSVRWLYSIDPCEPGGADHCNYTTPTIHVGGNTVLMGGSNPFAANIYNIFTAIN